MKIKLTLLFLLSFQGAFAGTGGARDTELLYLVMIAFLSVILAVIYSVSFVRRILHNRRERRWVHLSGGAEGEV